ncbi:hypothetical protein SEA_PHINKY_4 [Microbacterium phage Phinky]|nr:hypothetical protein SEA_PHINKY_4 [Microbacterium phage Phinky]
MKLLARCACWFVGHRWKIVGHVFRGFERAPRQVIWKCDRCRVERQTHPWMRPAP